MLDLRPKGVKDATESALGELTSRATKWSPL